MKVLIVDDEKLVRKGFIAIMPWERYNMQVVGEAGNGEKALEFIRQNEVDLLITDITMPGMPGLELMKIVHEEFPHIWIVVLTCHQDFRYIQEAMRYGVIDFIVKTQLEKETMDEIIDRISARIEYETRRRGKNPKENACDKVRGSIADRRIQMKYSDEVVNSIIRAIAYIDAAPAADINQDTVAKEVNMSRGYFSQCFKDIIGQAFGEYVHDMRMEKAKDLLLHTGMPIYSIAEQQGFQDERYFSKVFREHTGLLPTDYRSRNIH